MRIRYFSIKESDYDLSTDLKNKRKPHLFYLRYHLFDLDIDDLLEEYDPRPRFTNSMLLFVRPYGFIVIFRSSLKVFEIRSSLGTKASFSSNKDTAKYVVDLAREIYEKSNLYKGVVRYPKVGELKK